MRECTGQMPQAKTGTTVCNRKGTVTRAISKNLHEKLSASGPGQASCVSLHNRNAYGHLAKAILILCENSNKKMLRPKSGTTVCASLRSGTAQGYFTRAISC